MQINAVLVDDELPALSVLAKLLGNHETVHIAAMCSDPFEALERIDELAPDVIFIDIEMPDMSGLELAARLSERRAQPEIVFVTAYSQYALQAFHVNALHYLLKPVHPATVADCLQRLYKRLDASKGKALARPPAPPTDAATALPEERAGSSVGSESRNYVRGFGTFEVSVGVQRETIRFPTAKTEELFAFLLLNRRRSVAKWELCEQLWPDRAPGKAEQNLHTSIFRLKHALLRHGLRFDLDSRRSSYRLLLQDPCDFIEFDDALPDMPAPDRRGDPGMNRLESLLRLYRGHLFEEKAYEWSLSESERLRRKYAAWALHFTGMLLTQNKPRQAAEQARALLSHNPYEEEGHLLLLQALLAMGDRTAFLRQYEQCRERFAADLGLPLNETLARLHSSVVQTADHAD